MILVWQVRIEMQESKVTLRMTGFNSTFVLLILSQNSWTVLPTSDGKLTVLNPSRKALNQNLWSKGPSCTLMATTTMAVVTPSNVPN